MRQIIAQGPQPQGPQVTLGTGFTYQGQLKNNGAPVNGPCNIAFRLYDAASSGNQVGSPLTQTVPITNGLFTTPLDFGADVFTGNARWLDMQVHCPAGPGSYTMLAPRQALTAAPYALSLMPGAVVIGSAHKGLDVETLDGSSYAAGVYGKQGTGADVGDVTPAGVRGFSSSGYGVLGISVNTNGVYGTSSNAAGVFGISNNSSSAGVQGNHSSGIGVYGHHFGTTGTAPGMLGETDSTDASSGVVGRVTSATPDSFSSGVHGINNGTSLGIGVWGEQNGFGYGVYGVTNGSTGAGYGVVGQTNSTAGAGVYAAGAGAPGIALKIESGGIRVAGAGVGTSTPVFVHQMDTTAITGNACGVYNTADGTVVDNPFTNGDPKAILLVTPVGTANYDRLSITLHYNTGGGGSDPACGVGKWIIYTTNGSNIPNLVKFNVMVIKP